MGLVVSALYQLRDTRGENKTTVLVVAHTGWENQTRSRGSSRLPSDVDFVHLAEKDARSGVFTLRCTKLKEDQPPDPRHFTLGKVQVLPPCEGHSPVTSCVLQKATIAEEETVGANDEDAGKDQPLLDYLDKHPGASAKAAAYGTPANTKTKHQDEANTRKQLKKLEKKGKVTSGKVPDQAAIGWFLARS